MTNIFQGKQVRLRAYEPIDEMTFRHWDRTDTDIGRTLYEIPFPMPPLDEAGARAREIKPHEGENFPFTIEMLDGQVVGAIHIHDCNMRFGTFMYGISVFPDQQRKGYASEAIRLVLRYYFDERRYQKCTIEAYSFNEASIRLHEGLGFTLEGRLRRMVYSEGKFHDVSCYGMTSEEFHA